MGFGSILDTLLSHGRQSMSHVGCNVLLLFAPTASNTQQTKHTCHGMEWTDRNRKPANHIQRHQAGVLGGAFHRSSVGISTAGARIGEVSWKKGVGQVVVGVHGRVGVGVGVGVGIGSAISMAAGIGIVVVVVVIHLRRVFRGFVRGGHHVVQGFHCKRRIDATVNRTRMECR